jgi:hypothetical protein
LNLSGEKRPGGDRAHRASALFRRSLKWAVAQTNG